jgi:hypothetical protein
MQEALKSLIYSSRTKLFYILHSKKQKEKLQRKSKYIGSKFKNFPKVTKNKRSLNLALSPPIYTNS